MWFDFDALGAARSRPIKTWTRAKRMISAQTDAIVTATSAFVTSHAATASEMTTDAGAASAGNDAAVAVFNKVLKELGVAQ